MAADGKGSFEDPDFPAHERIGKQMALPFGLCMNIAGVVDSCHSLMNRISTALEAIAADSNPDLDVIPVH